VLAIARTDSVYIALPEPGAYRSEKYWNSGKQTQDAFSEAFEANGATVVIADEVQFIEEAKTVARASGARYLIFPVITQWEDHLTEWSGYPDFIGVKIDLVSLEEDGKTETGKIHAHSGLATLGGDHPEDLLPTAVSEYVNALYDVEPDEEQSVTPIQR
jgi:hypothetical protein